MENFVNKLDGFSSSDRPRQQLNLMDIVDLIRCNWRFLLVFASLGLISGVAAELFLPKKHEVTATIRPAIVSLVISSDLVASHKMAAARLLDSISLPVFYSDPALAACGNQKPVVSLAAGGELVQFSFKSNSASRGRDCLRAVVTKAAAQQEEAVKPFVQILKDRFQIAKASLDSARKLQAMIEKNLSQPIAGSHSDSSGLNFIQMGYGVNSEIINRLEGLYIEQQMLLKPPFTREAELVGEILEAPVPSKTYVVLLSGVLGGLSIGMLILLLRRALFC